jgi:hypothetical protein
MKTALRLAAAAILTIAPSARAQNAPPIDGPDHPLRDSLLEQLAGHWRVERRMRSQTTTHTADGDWVLNHQFLRLHYQSPGSKEPYEAMVFIGYDNMSERYVAHWIDIFGGRVSETLGFGARVPNGIRFVFEYPDGPFTNTLTFAPDAQQWASLMRQKNQRGEWVTFAEERFTKASAP